LVFPHPGVGILKTGLKDRKITSRPATTSLPKNTFLQGFVLILVLLEFAGFTPKPIQYGILLMN
jgi:hypothetical protein